TQLASFLNRVEREDLILVPVEDVRCDFRFREIANRLPKLNLLRREFKVHYGISGQLNIRRREYSCMPVIAPASAEELAHALKAASSESRAINVFGKNSKRLMGGPVKAADVDISTAKLQRVLQYERDDLTISVEAGMPFSSLQALLAKNGQMIALDPPFSAQATIGGVVA